MERTNNKIMIRITQINVRLNKYRIKPIKKVIITPQHDMQMLRFRKAHLYRVPVGDIEFVFTEIK